MVTFTHFPGIGAVYSDGATIGYGFALKTYDADQGKRAVARFEEYEDEATAVLAALDKLGNNPRLRAILYEIEAGEAVSERRIEQGSPASSTIPYAPSEVWRYSRLCNWPDEHYARYSADAA